MKLLFSLSAILIAIAAVFATMTLANPEPGYHGHHRGGHGHGGHGHGGYGHGHGHGGGFGGGFGRGGFGGRFG